MRLQSRSEPRRRFRTLVPKSRLLPEISPPAVSLGRRRFDWQVSQAITLNCSAQRLLTRLPLLPPPLHTALSVWFFFFSFSPGAEQLGRHTFKCDGLLFSPPGPRRQQDWNGNTTYESVIFSSLCKRAEPFPLSAPCVRLCVCVCVWS